MSAIASQSMPERETGWSHPDDSAKKRQHDFNNTLNELVFAVELRDAKLIAGYVQILREMYRDIRR